MLNGAVRHTAVLLFVGLTMAAMICGPVRAQNEPLPEDAAIDLIRQVDNIGEGDQSRIADWVRKQFELLAQAPAGERREAAGRLRETFRKQFEDSRNTQAFKVQFPAQTARVAEPVLVKSDTDPIIAYAISRVLLDMNRAEALPGYLAGLRSASPVSRYLCARGIVEQQQAIAGDKERLERTISGLREAGLTETNGVALTQIYRALAIPTQVDSAFDAMLMIMDKRLSPDGGAALAGPEVEAFNFFRSTAVQSVLNQARKTQLVSRLAGFLRVYADRYANANLDFEAADRLERSMAAVEELLEAVAGSGGGAIRKVLDEGGLNRRKDIPGEAAKWIGDPSTNTAGVLNSAPWNVPMAAPGKEDSAARPTGSTD